MFLAIFSVGVFAAAMYLLYKWVMYIGCEDHCTECGTCIMLCNGHNNTNSEVRDVMADCESCTRRSGVTRQESATNTFGRLKGKRVKVNRPDSEMFAVDVYNVCRPNDCKLCYWQLLPSHEEQHLTHGLSGLSYRSVGKNTTTEMLLAPPPLSPQ